jgi:hypothetical protein
MVRFAGVCLLRPARSALSRQHRSVYTTRGLISSSIAASEPYHRRVCFLPIAGGIVQRVTEGVSARVALELDCAPELQYLVGAIPVR